VVEDPDAPMAEPFVHWLLWNVPGTATELPAGLSRVVRPPELPGAVQGHNSGGKLGWHGTQPPEGHGVHHYHFQLFALSATLDHLGPNTSLEELVNALKGLTIASGQLVGTYERPGPGDVASPGRTGSYGREPSNEHPPRGEVAEGRGGLDADDPDRHAPHDEDGDVRRR